MGKTESPNAPPPGFDVEISSGGRAFDAGVPSEGEVARILSPNRAAAKERTRRRVMALVALSAVVLLVVVGWAWRSNPDTNKPPDAVARVNGEFIRERDVTREIDLTR